MFTSYSHSFQLYFVFFSFFAQVLHPRFVSPRIFLLRERF